MDLLDAFVGPGVVIEKRAVVGARSVVFKDVAESCVVAGNVAQFLKKKVTIILLSQMIGTQEE